MPTEEVYDAKFREVPNDSKDILFLECVVQMNKSRPGLCGFAVAVFEDGKPIKYLAGSYWKRIEERRVVNPRLWPRQMAASRTAERLRNARDKDLREEKAVVAFWCHPEAFWPILKKYALMDGNEFPGSPRQ